MVVALQSETGGFFPTIRVFQQGTQHVARKLNSELANGRLAMVRGSTVEITQRRSPPEMDQGFGSFGLMETGDFLGSWSSK